jgi:hypothetical protein
VSFKSEDELGDRGGGLLVIGETAQELIKHG